MLNEALLFEDSRDFAKFIDGLGDELPLPEDKIKMLRRLAKEPRPLSAEDELKALRKILTAVAPVLVENGPDSPIELITIVYCLSEMIAIARDYQAGGALIRLQKLGIDDPDAEFELEGLQEKLLSAAVREIMVVHGMQDMVIADHRGAIDLEWLREFGTRLIVGEEAFGFSAKLSRLLVTNETATLLSVEDEEFEISRYIVATYDPLPEGPEWYSQMAARIREDRASKVQADEEATLTDPEANSNFFSVSGNSSSLLGEVAHQMWLIPPDVVLVAIAENETEYRCLVQSITEGVFENDSPMRILH